MLTAADTAAAVAGCRGNTAMNESVAPSNGNNNNNSELSSSAAVDGAGDARRRRPDRQKPHTGLYRTTSLLLMTGTLVCLLTALRSQLSVSAVSGWQLTLFSK